VKGDGRLNDPSVFAQLDVAEYAAFVEDQPGETYEEVALVLRSALAGDGDGVVGTFDAVVDREGVGGAYGLAWGLAAQTVGTPLRRGPWQLDFPGIEDADYDARWVARFLSAYANADASTGEALFGAAIADGKLPQCLLTLAGSAVATIRRRAT
jgi:hypothetical protein